MALSKEEILEGIAALTVMDVVELVSAMEEKFGVSAGAVAMAAPAAAAGASGAEQAKAEEKTEFDVVIKDAGPKKIEVIKVIRQLTSLGLGDAKTMAETAGGKILTQVGKDAAEEAKKKLEEAGAVIELA